jgi:YD repeat-containing protein
LLDASLFLLTAMYQFNSDSTRRDLAVLPFPAVLAFAAACIERTFPCLEHYYAATPSDAISLDKFAQARDTIWSATLDPSNAVSLAQPLLPDCEVRLIDEDQAFAAGVPGAEDASACIVYGLRLMITGDRENAVWIAQRLYDAADRVALAEVAGAMVTEADEARLMANPAVQAELHRQRRDLAELGATAGGRRNLGDALRQSAQPRAGRGCGVRQRCEHPRAVTLVTPAAMLWSSRAPWHLAPGRGCGIRQNPVGSDRVVARQARQHALPDRMMRYSPRLLAPLLACLLLAPVALGAGTVGYSYDALHRLTAVSYPDGARIQYSYDPAGNMTQKTYAPALDAQCGPDEHFAVTSGPQPGATKAVLGCRSISVESGVLVPPTSSLQLMAYDLIRLQPGFRVALGGQLSARIDSPGGAGTSPLSTASPATAGAAPAGARAAESAARAAPVAPIPVAQPEQLSAALQVLLDLYGVDRASMAHLLADPDGAWLLFESAQDILPADANGASDIYRLDTFLETLSLISRTPEGAAGNGPSRYPAADATGEFVVFQSAADDLVEGDTNGVSDIFLHDAPVAETSRITLLDAGAAAHPALDAAGQDLLYDQRGEDGRRHVLLEGLWNGLPAETLSLPDDATGAALDNHHPAISADGRYVAYLEAAERADGGAPGCRVYFYDRDTGGFERAACPEALAANPEAARPTFSTDGTQVEWFLPGADNPVVVPNPLAGVATGAEK